MNILSIGAHPDDIELNCAGTLLMIKSGKIDVTVTSGERVDENIPKNIIRAIRRKEFAEASKIIGAESIFLDFEDQAIKKEGLVKDIKKILISKNIGLIFTHYPKSAHKDHEITSRAVIEANGGRIPLVFWKDYSSIDANPNLIVPIKEKLELKKEALTKYKSQLSFFEFDRILNDGKNASNEFFVVKKDRDLEIIQGLLYPETKDESI